MYGSTMGVNTNGGCPYCGCTCSATACMSQGQNILVVDFFEPIHRGIRDFDLDAMLSSLKFTESVVRWFPEWLIELRAIPRRMKRHFPRCLPGPPLCYAPARSGHRNQMRIKRLWRHAC